MINHHHVPLPDCAPCGENKHDDCVPLLTQGNKSTVCACFAAHPETDEHTNALFWWGEYGTQAQEAHIHYGGDAT